MPRKKNPVLIIAAVLVTLIFAMFVQAKDYDAVCKKMWKNPFGMMAMKEYPVIVAPQEGDEISSTSSSMHAGKESVSVALHTCTDPNQKHIYFDLRSGKGHDSPITELQAYDKEIGGSTHFGTTGQVYSRYHYEFMASYDKKTWSPARKFFVDFTVNPFPQAGDSKQTPWIEGAFKFLTPSQDDVFSSNQTLPIRIAMPARLPTDLKMKISIIYGKESGGIDHPGTFPKVIWSHTVDPIALYAGTVFEYMKMLDFLGSNVDIKARESGYYQIQADLISVSGFTPLKTTTSKNFRITSDNGSLTIVTPDANHTYTGGIPLSIAIPSYTYSSASWELILTWSIKPGTGFPAIPGDYSAIQVARQKFAYSFDNEDAMPISDRTWTIGGAGVKHFTASLPVMNLLAKAGVSSGIVSLNARFTIQGKSKPAYEKNRVFMVHLPSQNATSQVENPEKVSYPIIVEPKEHQQLLEGQQVWVKVNRKANQEITLVFYKDGKVVPVERLSLNTNPGVVHANYMLDQGQWVVIANYTKHASQVSSPRAFQVGTINTALMQNQKLDKSTIKGILPTAPVIISPLNKEIFQDGEPIILQLQHSSASTHFSFELERRELYSKKAFKNIEKWFGTFSAKDDLVRHLQSYGTGEYRIRVGASLVDNDWGNSVLSPWLQYKVITKDQKISKEFLQLKSFVSEKKKVSWVPLVVSDASQKTSLSMPNLDLKPESIGKQTGSVSSSLKVASPGKDLHTFLPKEGIRVAQSEKGKLSGITNKNSINPQPEPPGKQIKHTNMPLSIMPHAHIYRQSEKIRIVIKNTPFKRIPFELRYRPAASKQYKIIKKSDHTFTRVNGISTLNFILKNPGEYQVRFRANHTTPWTNWSSFKVLENPSGFAAMAHTMRIMPTASRAINPQPEPPGKSSKMRSVTAGRRTVATKVYQSKSVTKLQWPALKIHAPRNGQKYMLTGNTMHIKAAITHGNGQQIQVEVKVKNGGRFIPVKTRISKHQMKTKTDVDILISNPGEYRLRVRPQRKNGRWTAWINFSVDTPMKHRSQLSLQKTTHSKITSGKKTHPTVQRIREGEKHLLEKRN